jgi:hypothetical protein
MSDLEREIYIVLSTAHLTQRTVQSIDSLPITQDNTEARIRIPMLEYLANANLALPEDLTAVIAMIHTQAPDAYGIFFDCDGPVVPYLPTYPW